MEKINVYLNSPRLTEALREAEPLCRYYALREPLHEGTNIIITNELPESMNASAKYILCSSSYSKLKASELENIYMVWPFPLTKALAKFYFRRLLECLRTERQHTSEHNEYQKRLTEMAHQDYLTGLATRWYLQEYVKTNEHEENITCIYIDLDHFKSVNDTYGHQAGDRALAATAEMMQNEFTDGFCARMGGDEFMIVLAGERDITDVERKVNDFMKKLLAYYATTRTMKKLSVSAGISQRLNGQEKSIDRLIHESDLALYSAKKAGRSCCKIYTPSMEKPESKTEETITNYYLIDYENVKNHGFAGIDNLTSHDEICIFYSDNAQGSFTVELLQKMNDSPARITYIKASVGTKNALDFQLAAYLGELIAGHKDTCRYFIVSNDRGYESLISYGHNRKVNVKVIPSIAGSIRASDEMKQKVSEILSSSSEEEVTEIAKIIENASSRIEVNGEIGKYIKDSKRAGEIYRAIKPLIPHTQIRT